MKSGPNQDQTGSDGIGDLPYIIDVNKTDHYPLMYPWGSPPSPSYTLFIFSSPTGATFTVDDAPRTTPWSETYSEDASVTLEMPATHNGYFWSHWLEDGDTNRTKTAIMNTSISLTAVYTSIPEPVGGKATPINKAMINPVSKLELLAPNVGLTILLAIAAATVVYVKKRKRNRD